MYSGKVVLFGQGGCIRAKVVAFRQKGLYFAKNGFVRVKVVVFGPKWLYSRKVVAVRQHCCIRVK